MKLTLKADPKTGIHDSIFTKGWKQVTQPELFFRSILCYELHVITKGNTCISKS